MKFNVERKVLAGLITVLLLMAGIGLDSSFSIKWLVENTRHASDSVNVRRKAQGILFTMLNLETGTRGYVITGDDLYLEPYRNAVDGVSRQMTELSQALANAPGQQQRFQKLAELVTVELAIEKHHVELRQKQDFEAAAREFKTDDGKRVMDQIREMVADIVAEQDQLMSQESQRAVQQARRTTWTIAVGGVCGFLFVAAAGGVIHQDLRRRREAAEQLAQSEERFRQLVEGATEYSIIRLDPQGRIETWNAGAQRIKGYERQEIIGQHFSRFYTPEDIKAGKPQRVLDTAVQEGQYVEEGWRVQKDGSRFWANVLITQLRDTRGNTIGFSKITRDITAEEALLKAGALQNAIFNSANFSSIATDAKGVIQIFNVGAERMLGYTAAEVMSKITPADISDPQEVVARAKALSIELETPITPGFEALVFKASRGIEDIYELTYVRKDGSRFPAVVSVTALRDAQDAIIGYLLIGTDNTARKEADEALRKNEAQLQTIVESLGEGVIVCDLNGQAIRCNHAALELHGYASHDECLSSLAEFAETFELSGMDGTVWPVDQWPLARVLRGEKLRDLELRIRRIQGDWQRIFRYGGNLVLNPDGQPLMAVVTISDITERTRAEAELRKSEAQLQTIVESLGEGVAVSDLNGQLLHFNRAALDLHGYACLDEIRRHLSEFADTFELAEMDGTVIPLAQWPLARVLRGEKLHDWEVRIRRIQAADWQRVFRYGGTLVRDSGGEPLMAVVTISDITERKRAAEVIRQLNTDLEQRVVERTAQLLTANNELEAFSYSVSHDLRAPLRSLDGFSQALMEDCADKLNSEDQDNLQRIRNASQRMGHLIDDLLNLSRLTRAEMSRDTVDLSKLAQEVVDELRAGDSAREANFVIAQGLVAEADPRLLRIALTNLFANAWKFTAKRPDARIEFGSAGENGNQAFFVRDNGVGFDMAHAGKLFGAFQRLHAMNDFPGTGIGLVTVQRIVHRHGGRIWAESAVDAGATFHFTLN